MAVRRTEQTPARRRGFTLIELLVVIAIIAVLVGILLPSLGAARKEAQALKCAAQARSVAQGFAVYQSSYGVFPLSYAYAVDATAPVWDKNDQGLNDNGKPYIHWSYSLMADGDRIPGEAFKCPSAPSGGAPRTNPGDDAKNRESWQTTYSSVFEDWQAPRMAYTGNAAIFPRNKLALDGAQRRNIFVSDAAVTIPSKVILATEFLKELDWQVIASGNVSKSHRSINPFVGGSSGSDVYNEPDTGSTPRFFYPSESEILPQAQITANYFANTDATALNAVGRSHQGGDKRFGGTANFSFVDGHVERMTVLETVKKRLWGDKFYSLSGKNNKVADAGY